MERSERRILIADDVPVFVKEVIAQLAQNGYNPTHILECYAAEAVLPSLDVLAGGYSFPHAIVLDTQMLEGGMRGTECCECIKSAYGTDRSPYVIGQSGDVNNEQKYLAAGADVFLSKLAIAKGELVPTLDKLLE